MVLLVAWALWKEWNTRFHNQTALAPATLVQRIKDEGHYWSLAGFRLPPAPPVAVSVDNLAIV
jgi:hypothetical protein